MNRIIGFILTGIFLTGGDLGPIAMAQGDPNSESGAGDLARVKALRDSGVKFQVELERQQSGANERAVLFQSESTIDDALLAKISEFDALVSLSIAGSFTDDALDNLKKLPKLERLEISSSKLTDSALAKLAVLGSLKHLDIQSLQIRNGDLSEISKLAKLEILKLPSFKTIGDDQIAQIRAISTLRYLKASGASISDQGLKEIAQLKALRFLDISGSPISDEGLVVLGTLPELNCITLDGILLRPETVSELRRQCKNLKYVIGQTGTNTKKN